ncbi:hypothetical protein SAMN05216389_10768 [Oceanobacillus limi]|uniref:Uncharacterized protein n=1 Tax=Oceanobacillus limi TaxID=930131 RepID=A0A1I0CTH7_9BACI|nr:hypothetical protein [Oceanobacillus limi]SET22907.1 hypothetical protein SAMN05216389_10768 [Oceanobacillus limi]
MMKDRLSVGKVIEFAQTETNAKKFHQEHPISDELRNTLLLDVFNDFTRYVVKHNYVAFITLFKPFMEEHHLLEEKRNALEHNLFWWHVFYQAYQDLGSSDVEFYIKENASNQKPIIKSWLREWHHAVPKFYHIGYKHSDRSLVVTDMMETRTLDVMILNRSAVAPMKGEIVMGTLIPIGDRLYFPITDFYHFDFDARKEIAGYVVHCYETSLDSSSTFETFLHILSTALQIENQVRKEN